MNCSTSSDHCWGCMYWCPTTLIYDLLLSSYLTNLSAQGWHILTMRLWECMVLWSLKWFLWCFWNISFFFSSKWCQIFFFFWAIQKRLFCIWLGMEHALPPYLPWMGLEMKVKYTSRYQAVIWVWFITCMIFLGWQCVRAAQISKVSFKSGISAHCAWIHFITVTPWSWW